jgi:hypothetical protein
MSGFSDMGFIYDARGHDYDGGGPDVGFDASPRVGVPPGLPVLETWEGWVLAGGGPTLFPIPYSLFPAFHYRQ